MNIEEGLECFKESFKDQGEQIVKSNLLANNQNLLLLDLKSKLSKFLQKKKTRDLQRVNWLKSFWKWGWLGFFESEDQVLDSIIGILQRRDCFGFLSLWFLIITRGDLVAMRQLKIRHTFVLRSWVTDSKLNDSVQLWINQNESNQAVLFPSLWKRDLEGILNKSSLSLPLRGLWVRLSSSWSSCFTFGGILSKRG